MGEQVTQDRSFDVTDEGSAIPGPPNDDDEEAALEELIEGMVTREEAAREAEEASPPTQRVRGMRGNEFTCRSCHLIMARSCLADEQHGLCHECVREDASEEGPPHRHVVERPCPVCGWVTLVPERPDAVCGYFCADCGVHLTIRRGHRYLEWDHRYHPESGPLAGRVSPPAHARVKVEQ
jgi:hypothetical protein